MRSRTSFCNKTLFLKNLFRFWPVWLGGGGICFLMETMYFLNWANNPYRTLVDLRYHIVTDLCGQIHVLWFIFSLATAAAVFGWMYNARSAGFTAALPMKRSTLFASSYLAGLTMLISALLVNGGIMMAVSLIYLGKVEKLILLWLLVSLLDIVGFYGFGVLCAQLTGNLVILPLCALALEFAAVLVEKLVCSLMGTMLFGYKAGEGILSYASPLDSLCFRCGVEYISGQTGSIVEYGFKGLGMIAVYGAFGVLFSLLALKLFINRRMEAAGDTVAIGILKPVFRWCMAVGCALLLSVGIYDLTLQGRYVPCTGRYLLLILALLLLGGLAGWFGADMLITKSFRVFKLHRKGAVLLSSLLLAFGLGLGFDVLGLEKQIPDQNSFDQVFVWCDGETANLDELESMEQVLKLHSSIIAHKAEHQSNAVENYRMVNIEYYKGNDCVLSRSYYLAATKEQQDDRNSDLRFTERVLNLQEAIAERKKIGIAVSEHTISRASISQWEYFYNEYMAYQYKATSYYSDVDISDVSNDYFGGCRGFNGGEWRLSPKETYELFTECILPDLEEGTLGRVWLVGDEEYAKTIYNIQFQMCLDKKDASGNYVSEWFYTVPTIHSKRTNAWLAKHGVKLETYWDYLARMGGLESLG